MAPLLHRAAITSGESNLTKGCIAATHEQFNRIRQVAPICTRISIRTVPVLYVDEPRTFPGIGCLPSWFLGNQILNYMWA